MNEDMLYFGCRIDVKKYKNSKKWLKNAPEISGNN